MDWTSSFIKAINYIEEHLLDDISISDIAGTAYISPFYFQKVFSIYTGYSVSEYIRCRRLYCAALDLKSKNISIIDIAYKYCYDTPESFTKAFSRFHGVTPSKAKEATCPIKIFLPLHINLSIVGGNVMDCIIEKMEGLKIIGFKKVINADEGYKECPKFWDYISENYFYNSNDKDLSKVIKDNNIGEFAVCYDGDGKTFNYIIGGLYKGGRIPSEMTLLEIPDYLWVKFKCLGPLPGALQSINTMIWKDWIPNNPKYDLAANIDIEWYSNGDVSKQDYESAIWLPVKEK